MVEHGHDLLDAALHRAERIRTAAAELPGLRPMGREVVEEGLAASFDPLKIVIDVRLLGISGMQAAEWLRAHRHVDVGGSDTCRISASITCADNDETDKILLDALRALVEGADFTLGPCCSRESSRTDMSRRLACLHLNTQDRPEPRNVEAGQR